MPNKYDQLRKKASLQKPINMKAIDVDGTYKGEPLDLNFKPAQFEEMPVTEEAPEPREYQQKDNSNMYLGDLAASAGPGLLALLGGASPSVTTSLFDKGNVYAMKRGAQEEVTKANTSVIDINGEPLNVRTRDALGEKPFYPSRLASGNQGANDRVFPPITLKNVNKSSPDYGKTVGALSKSSGYFNPETNERYSMNDWLPFRQDVVLREKTIQGGQVVKVVNPYNMTGSSPKVISSQSGLGDNFGGLSKEEAMSGIKSAEKGKAAAQKPVEAYQNALSAYETLSSPNLTPEKAAAGIVSIVKATNGERLSDTDYANLRGEEFKSYVRIFEDWSSGKIVGEINPKIIAAYLEVSEDVMRNKKREAQAIKRNYVPDNLIPSKSGQKKLDTAVGKEIKSGPGWKSKFKDL